MQEVQYGGVGASPQHDGDLNLLVGVRGSLQYRARQRRPFAAIDANVCFLSHKRMLYYANVGLYS